MHAGKKLFWVETDEHDRHTITGAKPTFLFDLGRKLNLSSAESLTKSYDDATSSGGDPRIMLINSPSNPTGQAFGSATLDMIATFCRERKITLISDEIYADILFTKDAASSPAAHGQLENSQMILTGGLSKVCIQVQQCYDFLTLLDIFGWRVESGLCNLSKHRLRSNCEDHHPRLRI